MKKLNKTLWQQISEHYHVLELDSIKISATVYCHQYHDERLWNAWFNIDGDQNCLNNVGSLESAKEWCERSIKIRLERRIMKDTERLERFKKIKF